MFKDSSLLEVERGPYLSSLRVGDAGVAEVTALPFRVEAVSLELPELKGGMKGTSLHFDSDRVDPDGHPLHHLLCKAILAANRKRDHKKTGGSLLNRRLQVHAPLSRCDGYRRRSIRGAGLLAGPHFYFNLI